MNAHRLGDVARFHFGGNVAVVDPFQAVGGDLPPRLVHRRDRLAIARHRGRDRIDGDGNRAFREQAVQPPKACPRAVFVDRLHVHVAHARPGRGADDLGQERFGRGVAVQDVVLAPLLVIDDELQRDAGVFRPVGERRRAPVADHVAGIGLAVRHAHLSPGSALIAGRATLRQDRGLLQTGATGLNLPRPAAKAGSPVPRQARRQTRCDFHSTVSPRCCSMSEKSRSSCSNRWRCWMQNVPMMRSAVLRIVTP